MVVLCRHSKRSVSYRSSVLSAVPNVLSLSVREELCKEITVAADRGMLMTERLIISMSDIMHLKDTKHIDYVSLNQLIIYYYNQHLYHLYYFRNRRKISLCIRAGKGPVLLIT